ncbi:MAG: DUF4375 domain-containing protein [Sphingobacteriales bacterium]|nr:MAG: DUF4375 domain-containing protein [Sphingobacteriales bacterium]
MSSSKFLPHINQEAIEKARENDAALYDLLVQPLHEELYRRQDFNFLDDLSQGQQLLLSFDYVWMQVMQGGFIQLIQNGYIALLPPMPEWLQNIGDPEMAKLIDDVLKVYVLNRELLDKQTTVKEFAALYEEFKEFEILDEKFREIHNTTMQKILQYAGSHIFEFTTVVYTV